LRRVHSAIFTGALAGALTLAGLVGEPATAGAAAPSGGTVSVVFAGSLTNVMENFIGPRFDKATGYSFSGMSEGSDAAATSIKGGLLRADVFVSASPAVNKELEGSVNGNWVQWYAAFGTSPLVLGYNPKSTFATQLKTRPWYKVVTEPGFLIGRTDPALDPKGTLASLAIKSTAKATHTPALLDLLHTTTDVFPEQTLVGRLQAGQLDAAFFYAAEAKAAGIPTVTLPHVSLSATYTVTVLRSAPDPAGAQAFVSFLLGPSGRGLLTAAGVRPIHPPAVSGHDVPHFVTAGIRTH
jgi:molybdate/tungstate transport system substrate-binding protein